MFIGTPPAPTQALLDRAKDVWQQAKCWECHGETGRGDGEKAIGLRDDSRFPIRPADLTTGQFKSGSTVEDIFRTMSTGLAGTPMPSYSDSLPEEDRWALRYYVLSLSAFKDPLTGEPLNIAEADRAVLNDPGTIARTSDTAYVPIGDRAYARDDDDSPAYAGTAWAQRRGIEVVPGDESSAAAER